MADATDDLVLVQPVRTFLEGAELMTPDSAPFSVSRPHMLELRGNGFVELVEAAAETDPVAPEPDAPAATGAPAEPVAPARRGRGRPRKAG